MRQIRERDDYRIQESVTSESRCAFNGSWNYDKDEFLREKDKYENQYYVEERKHKLLGGVLSAEMNLPEHEQPLRMVENIVDTIVNVHWRTMESTSGNSMKKKLSARKVWKSKKGRIENHEKMLNADEISDDDDSNEEDEDYFEEEMRIHRRENKLLTEKLVKSIWTLWVIQRMNIEKNK